MLRFFRISKTPPPASVNIGEAELCRQDHKLLQLPGYELELGFDFEDVGAVRSSPADSEGPNHGSL